MDTATFIRVLNILEKEFPKWNAPVVSLMAKREHRTPFQILISTIISLRTKDQVTAEASERLFKLADNPYDMLKLTEEQIAKAIYPAGFYRNKAKTIKKISEIIVKKNSGEVPDSLEELLKLPGVGRKTANLVLALSFDKPAVCVDIHVHRITNRLGFVKTKTPEETEKELMKKVPVEYWNRINDLLVAFGQTICKPLSPLCSKCPVEAYCEKVGVVRHR
ncbi:endonuclease-3 [Persephonella hydrogeniphila]|uniref:Endonuclease III n=1 Tax=Persephonella hydrogeniphila TaxID=198703 RepID=A0A285NM44_9AQUI|nr:endonuclease III [Persephonella hydrogeniphila]SNZ08926.1 endonuclease-3 [Persephonella hydrogeniphila]